MAARSLVLVALACAAVACQGGGTRQKSKAPAPAAAEGSAVALDPSLTVATIDGLPITAAQLDERAASDLRKVEREYIENAHGARDRMLRTMVSERLVELEAKARGVTTEALLKQEIEDKIPQPTDDDVRAAYEQFVKPRFPVSYEQAYDKLKAEMVEDVRRRATEAFHGQLEQKYKVQVSLPPPRLPKVDVAATGPAKGPENAPVTVVEFSDFECPFCSRAATTVDEVIKGYEGKVRLVFRHFPLPFHTNAQKAHEAALCAQDQGKFWEMHDRLFQNQQQLEVAQLKEHAKAVGLDEAKFAKCLDSGEKAEAVKADLEAGKTAGVEGTPTFFVNGRPMTGAPTPEGLKAAIDGELNPGGAKPAEKPATKTN